MRDERRVAARGARLYVRTVGPVTSARVPIVLVHGGPGLSAEYLTGLELLADARRVISWDQRGAGRTGGELTIDDRILDVHADDLESVRRASSAPRVHLVAHSFGGLVAAAYAIARPERVASLVFVDVPPPHPDGLRSALERLRARIARLQGDGIIPTPLPAPAGDDARPWLEAVAPAYFADPAYVRRLEVGSYRTGIADATFAALARVDLRPALAAVTVPTLVIACGTPFGDLGSQLFDAMSSAPRQLCALPFCGHFPWIEAPGPSFDALRAFFDEVEREDHARGRAPLAASGR